MALPTQRNTLITTLPPMTDLIRGTLVRYIHDHDPCHPNGRYVYWYLSIKQKGQRTHMRKLQNHHVPLVRKAIRDYNRWWKTCLKIFELNTQIALSKEA